jgi:hypothetical protein
MSNCFVICEFAEGCRSESCGFTKPTRGHCMEGALCGHIDQKVDIIEYNEIAVSDPNYQFKRKKHGF